MARRGVFTMGRFSVVSRPISSSKNSARCEIWNVMSRPAFPAVSLPTFPAPQKIWRVTKCGVMRCAMRANGMARSMR